MARPRKHLLPMSQECITVYMTDDLREIIVLAARQAMRSPNSDSSALVRNYLFNNAGFLGPSVCSRVIAILNDGEKHSGVRLSAEWQAVRQRLMDFDGVHRVHKDLSKVYITNMPLSVRTVNCMLRSHIYTAMEASDMTYEDMFELRAMGAQSVSELTSHLLAYGVVIRHENGDPVYPGYPKTAA